MDDARPASVLHLHALDRSGEDEGQFQHRVANAISLIDAASDLAPAHRSWLSPDAPRLAVSADIVVIHTLSGIEIEGLIRARRAAGRTTLYEIGDDLSSPRQWSRRNPEPPGLLTVGRQLLHASLSDAAQFTSPWLCDRYAGVHVCRGVLDNLVAFPPATADKPDGFIVGWAGSRSHKDDLAEVAPAIMAFCGRHPDTRFALMGDAELWPLFAALGNRFEPRPFGAYADYRIFLASLHVGLVPLKRTPFNLGRSDVKPVEMAAEGGFVLAQDAEAYRRLGGAVELFTDAADLEARLERLYAGRAHLPKAARAMREAVAALRGEAAVRSQHLGWYRRWKKTTGGAASDAGVTQNPDAGSALDTAMRRARQGDPSGALDTARRLVAGDPAYVQARLFATKLLARLGRTADAAAFGAPLAGCPVFSNVWLPLASRLHGDDALRDRTNIPALRVRSHGEGAAAVASYHREMLAADPFHPFALAGEQRRLERLGAAAKADELRRRRLLFEAAGTKPCDGRAGP